MCDNIVSVYKYSHRYEWDFSTNKTVSKNPTATFSSQKSKELEASPPTAKSKYPLPYSSCSLLQLHNEFKAKRDRNFISKLLKH